jgi:hypothetical protein
MLNPYGLRCKNGHSKSSPRAAQLECARVVLHKTTADDTYLPQLIVFPSPSTILVTKPHCFALWQAWVIRNPSVAYERTEKERVDGK